MTLPKVPQSLIDEMRKVFPAPSIAPQFDRDTVLYQAGAHSVVQWLIAKSSVDASSGDGSKLREAVEQIPTGAVVRLGS